MTLVYKVNTASTDHMYEHLKACDQRFDPPLTSRVDLSQYCGKMHAQGVSFEAWEDAVLVGLVTAYMNDADGRSGFITNVSVLQEHTGKGVALALLGVCLAHAQKLGFRKLTLEVAQKDGRAVRLYKRAGFVSIAESGTNLLMECVLPIESPVQV